MLKRFHSGGTAGAVTIGGGIMSCVPLTEQVRTWVKPKKRPKVGAGFHEKAQKWREEFLLDRHRVLADSLKAYVEFSATKRTEPWDTRFKPFDRTEKDGVYVILKHMMDDKMQLCNNHPRATKRLLCNVGLMGPNVTRQARWKPHRFTQLPATATKAEKLYAKDRTGIHNFGYSDV